MLTNEDSQGVSNCYVFKSRLQEYAQKVALPTPVYETIKEGPSHQPSFRSTVILKDVRYDSLPGFFNRKAAEQSAAEIALVELAKSDEVNQSITQPVIETGLCKNLLQEYAQKMNYAMPLYLWKKDERPGRSSSYSCTVEIGGIRYIGASAKTKKEAEIKAARTALLAIESSASHSSEKQFGPSKLTVIPCKKRGAEAIGKVDETSKVPKTKKMRFKRKPPRKKQEGRNHIESAAYGGAKVESHANVNDESCVQMLESRTLAGKAVNFDNEVPVDYQNENGISSGEGLLSLNSSKILENGESMEVQSNDSCIQTVKYRPLAACAMKFFDNGMLIDCQNEKGILAGDDSLSLNSNKVFGNGNSTELPSNEFSLQIIESKPWAAEGVKIIDIRMPINYQNEKGLLAGGYSLSLNNNSTFAVKKSAELLSNDPCVQTMESVPVAQAMKNFNDGLSLGYQNEKVILAVEGSLSLDGKDIFENRKSAELQSSESCLRIMDSTRPAAEIRKNCDGMLVNDQNEKGPLAGEGSLSFADKKSTELLSNEHCVLTMESIPVAEGMKFFDDGVSLDYQNEKGTLAVEGSLSLDSNNICENRKSTELQSNEFCLPIMDSIRPAAKIKKNYYGMLVNDQNEKGPWAGEGSLSFADKKSTELLSNEPCVQTMESIPVAEGMKIFDDGVSLDYQNERGIAAVEGSLSLDSNNTFENRKSTELPSSESCLRIMDSTRPAAEIRKNCDGMLVNDQNEKGPLAGEGSLSFADKKSTELLSNEPCVQIMESIPVAEGMKNFDDGVSLDYQNERGIVAVEGSLSLDSNNIFENRKSTELQSSESCLPIMNSRRPAAKIQKNYDGMLVNDQNEKGPLAGEGSLSLNNSDF